jgi:hypothetical protein
LAPAFGVPSQPVLVATPFSAATPVPGSAAQVALDALNEIKRRIENSPVSQGTKDAVLPGVNEAIAELQRILVEGR